VNFLTPEALIYCAFRLPDPCYIFLVPVRVTYICISKVTLGLGKMCALLLGSLNLRMHLKTEQAIVCFLGTAEVVDVL
jgi:hypothetical protein